MCRRNQIPGFCLASFGLGVLIGSYIETGFFTLLLGTALIAGGLWVLLKK